MPAARTVDVGDPFARTAPAPKVRLPFEMLASLVLEESKLEPDCALKARDWEHPTCSSCPERGSHGRLCELGVSQEALVGVLA